MKIAHSLHQGGYNVMLVGWNMDAARPDFEHLEGLPCYRLPVHARFGRGVVNIVHQIRWQIALAIWLIGHRREYEIIHACDFDTVLAALLCRALLGKIVVYDIFDFYADMLRATPRWIRKIIKFIDLNAINSVDALILADDARYTQIRDAHPRRSVVIYNALQEGQGVYESGPGERPVSSELRLAYFGNLQVERGLIELLEVLRGHPEWQLDLGGFGGDEAFIHAQANSMINVTWHGRLPYGRVLELSSQADALIATYDPRIPNNRYASPNKLFEAMLLGKPILVAEGTNMDRIVNECGCGLVVPYGSRADLERALFTLHEQPELRSRMGNNARRAYEKNYNWQAMQSRLLQLYTGLLERR